MSTPNLLDAIRVVKENERIAMASYANAAKKIHNPMGKKLFEELSEFEKFHYEKLTLLETSLEQSGTYIKYEGKEFPQPPTFDIAATKEVNTKSVMAIITASISLEEQAEKAYADLATQTTDEQGHKLFIRLSDEEHNHRKLLREAYWSLTNLGTWTWVRP